MIWGFLLGGVYRWHRGQTRVAVLLAALVVSHWVLDWVTHRPDMPLIPTGGPKLGLGLWNSVAATLVIEYAMFIGAAWMYTRSTVATDRIGRWAWIGLVAFLIIVHATNAFSPPPPNMTAVVIGGCAIWLLVWWAAWADRHRTPRETG